MDAAETMRWLLSPVTPETFLDSYFEAKPLHVQRAAGHYGDLISRQSLEELLWQRERDIPSFVRLENRGEHFAPKVMPSGQYRKWVAEHFRRGATVIANGVDDYCANVAILRRQLSAFIDGDVTVNAYLTPANSQGFLAHFDTHDVFILQIEGRKEWRLYSDQTVELPLTTQMDRVYADRLSPPTTVVLSAGDLLYVPRGVVHEALTQDTASLHLTVGLQLLLWVDLLREAIDIVAEESVVMRRAISFDRRDLAPATAIANSVAQRLASPPVLEKALARVRHRFVSNLKPLPVDTLAEAQDDLETLVVSDRLMKRPGMVCHVGPFRDGVGIGFPGLGMHDQLRLLPGAIKAPVFVEPALEFIRDVSRPFAISELPGPLTDDAKVTLARRLTLEGLLTRAS